MKQLKELERIDKYKTKYNHKPLVTISEASQILEISRQAIYVSIMKKRLNCHKENKKWLIHIDDLEQYVKSKYSRDFHFTNDLISVRKASEVLKLPLQQIYYYIYCGRLNAKKIKGMYYIVLNDLHDIKLKKKKLVINLDE